jgi:hypothetical protein
MTKFTFDRKLSLDGVAIIIGVASALIYIGKLDSSVAELKKQADTQVIAVSQVKDAQIDLKADVAAVKSDVAVLSAVVVERTGKPLK